jgi:hypothetical protein
LKRTVKLSDIVRAPSYSPGTIQLVVRGESIGLALAGLVDISAERARLENELAKIADDIARIDQKLGNKNFVERAPEEVVEEQRERREEAENRKLKLEQALRQLKGAAPVPGPAPAPSVDQLTPVPGRPTEPSKPKKAAPADIDKARQEETESEEIKPARGERQKAKPGEVKPARPKHQRGMPEEPKPAKAKRRKAKRQKPKPQEAKPAKGKRKKAKSTKAKSHKAKGKRTGLKKAKTTNARRSQRKGAGKKTGPRKKHRGAKKK